MSLTEWFHNGWLIEHESSPIEVHQALALADRDLHDSQASEISTDWRFAIAYNAVQRRAQ